MEFGIWFWDIFIRHMCIMTLQQFSSIFSYGDTNDIGHLLAKYDY